MSIDESQEVYRAREQIRGLIDQIKAMSRQGKSEAEFFSALLDQTLQAMEAVAGLVWLSRDGGRVEPVCHAGLNATGVTGSPEAEQGHPALVQSLLGSPTGLVVPAGAELSGPDGKNLAANSTALSVIAVPIDNNGTRAGLIEVFQHPQDEPVERGYLVFMQQVAEVAGDYLQQRQVVALGDQQAALSQVERFARAVHESLDPVATAMVIANEARRIIGCDRVGVLVRRRRKLRLEAVSGQESIERRASEVQAIEALVEVVARDHRLP